MGTLAVSDRRTESPNLAAFLLHEVNNLLTPLEGVLACPERVGGDREAVRRAQDLCRRVRQLSQFFLTPASSDPVGCLSTAMDWLSSTFPDLANGVEIDPGPDRVPMDQLALETLLLNLLLNARQAQQGAVGGISIRCARSTRNLELAVTDRGRGMSEAELAAAERSGRYGLRICRWLVESAGGELAIVSQPGVGTTVRALLREEVVRKAA